ncbi:MAG: alanine racemase [Candidatus Chromulinivorax sp.]
MQSRYSFIDLDALAYNFKAVQQKVGNCKIMAIVKANAYGHGIVECARFFEMQGANYFGVALIEEAITLRKAGITLPILVLGGVMLEQVPLFLEYDIEIMASSIDKLLGIHACAQNYNTIAKVHLKIDTGLGRIGVRWTNAQEFFVIAMTLPFVQVVGVASHFATSDDQNQAYMQEQCARFEKVTQFFPQHGYVMPIRHIANSGAIIQYPESYFDMVRPGIMLYGVYPQSWMQSLLKLNPVMSLYARIVYFKVVLQGAGVSYGLRWKAQKDTRIITLPIGYGDGYPRVLSNKGSILLKGKRYPIVGNICMDQMMIDIGSDSAYCGDEVVLLGKSGNEKITINDVADICNMSPYELLVGLNNRIDRSYKTDLQILLQDAQLKYFQKNL